MMYPTTNLHPFSGIMWKCLFHMTNVHGNNWRANLWLTGLRNNCARTTMSSSKYVNTKMCNKVLIENITMYNSVVLVFSNLLLVHSFNAPGHTPNMPVLFSCHCVRRHFSSLFFSSIFSPVWQLGRKLPAGKKNPRAGAKKRRERARNWKIIWINNERNLPQIWQRN